MMIYKNREAMTKDCKAMALSNMIKSKLIAKKQKK